MVYNLNGKNIKVSDADIERSMKILKISKEEAIKVWLEDEGYLINEEQEKLEKKAKKNRVTATIHQAESQAKVDKKKAANNQPKESKRKENPVKESLIAGIAEFLASFSVESNEKVENIQILNAGKLISFSVGAENFEIDLKQKRKSKK